MHLHRPRTAAWLLLAGLVIVTVAPWPSRSGDPAALIERTARQLEKAGGETAPAYRRRLRLLGEQTLASEAVLLDDGGGRLASGSVAVTAYVADALTEHPPSAIELDAVHIDGPDVGRAGARIELRWSESQPDDLHAVAIVVQLSLTQGPSGWRIERAQATWPRVADPEARP